MELLYGGVAAGHITVERWVELTSTAPARLFGLYPAKGALVPGADADIVVFDPAGSRTLGVGSHHMAVDYSCYEGVQVSGRVDTVVSRGRVVVDGDSYLGRPGDGRFVRRSTAAEHVVGAR